MTQKHTPTPYHVRPYEEYGEGFHDSTSYFGVFDANNNCIADRLTEANAAFIVKACNAHDELVKVLYDLEQLFDGDSGTGWHIKICNAPNELVAKARAILAKVQS